MSSDTKRKVEQPSGGAKPERWVVEACRKLRCSIHGIDGRDYATSPEHPSNKAWLDSVAQQDAHVFAEAHAAHCIRERCPICGHEKSSEMPDDSGQQAQEGKDVPSIREQANVVPNSILPEAPAVLAVENDFSRSPDAPLSRFVGALPMGAMEPPCQHECGTETQHLICICVKCGWAYTNPENVRARADSLERPDAEVVEANLADYAKRFFDLFEMFQTAWLREMGGVIRPKHYEIDGFVLRARDIYEKAQLVDRMKQIMVAKLKEKCTAEELFDAVFEMLAEDRHDKIPTQ